jgi:uncharacterized SAM-binding protein YcdF (DUF218 family)
VRPDGTPSGTLRRRVEEAFRAAEGNDRARFLVTGGICPHPPAEAEVMRDLLLDLGASAAQIVVEDTARNTLESAVLCSGLLRARDDAGAVVVCSSRYHVHRCHMLLRLNGVRPDALVASQDAHRVGRARYAWSWARDAVALPMDAVSMTGRRVWGRLRRRR